MKARKPGTAVGAAVVTLAAAFGALGTAFAAPAWEPEVGAKPIASQTAVLTPGDLLGRAGGMATTRDGRGLWVVDTARSQLRRYGPDILGESYVIGGRGSRAGRFLYPTDVAVDPWGFLWVADQGNNRLQRVRADGRPVGRVPLPGVIAVAAADDGTVWALSGRGNTVVGLTVQGKIFTSWQVRPPRAEAPIDSRRLNGGAVLEATYGVTDIAVAPDGDVLVSGWERLRTRIDCSWYREHRLQLTVDAAAFGQFTDNPFIKHGYVWQFSQQGWPTNAAWLGQVPRYHEACWTRWETTGSVDSVATTPAGTVYFLPYGQSGGAAPPAYSSENQLIFGNIAPRHSPIRFEASCTGALLTTDGKTVLAHPALQGTPACNRRPPGPGLVFGPPKPEPGSGTVGVRVACTTGRCRGTVDIVVEPACRACTGSLAEHPPRRIDLGPGEVTRVSVPLRPGARPPAAGLRAVATVNGRRVDARAPQGWFGGRARVTLACAATGDPGGIRLSGRVVREGAGAVPGPVELELSLPGVPGLGLQVDPAPDGTYATSAALPVGGTWNVSATVRARDGQVSARSGCSVPVRAAEPETAPPPDPTPGPAPAPPPPPSTSAVTVRCVTSGDPATGGVTVRVTGAITPATIGVPVSLSYAAGGAAPTLRTVTSGTTGAFEDAFAVAPGAWTVTASWAGDAASSGSSGSATCS